MLSTEVTVRNRTGLHARPAATFVQEARRFQSAVTVKKDGRTADAKSILAVLALGVNQGARIELVADGPDEEEALKTLTSLIESGFGEE